jgi:EmrB/QacA subfamily drug resistance transporter
MRLTYDRVMAQPFVEPCSRGIIAAQPCPRELGREVAPRRRRMVLAACVLASSMAFIDGSALTVALPKLRAHFGADLASVQWVLNGYLLALASLTMNGGALADVYGKARVLSIGCVLFALASIGCAIVPSAGALVACRIAQGVAAALVAPASLALIGAIYPRDERNSAVAIWAGASALTIAAGPALGGLLSDRFGWQSIFWINPPIAVAAVGLLATFAPADRREQRRFDLIGAGILAAVLATLAWALGRIGSGESAPERVASPLTAVTAMAGAGAGLAAYAFWESLSKHPMTPPYLLHNRAFAGLNVATMMAYAGLSTMFFVLPFDVIERRGLSSTGAALVFLPFTLGLALLSPLFGRLADAIETRVLLIVGPAGAALAYIWLALGHKAPLVLGVVGPMALLGTSFAALVAPLTASVLSSVKSTDEGLASGINNAISRIAQLIGIALASGAASFPFGYEICFASAGVISIAAATTTAATLPKTAAKSGAS